MSELECLTERAGRSPTTTGSRTSSGVSYSCNRRWAKQRQSIVEFPPMQKGASFNMEAVKAQIQAAIAAQTGK